MGLNGCCWIIKYLVVLVNFLFLLVGLTTVVLAVWMLTDPTFLISMTQDENNYYIGLYIFLAIGALMLIVAFLGCCGAFKESQCLLVSFFCCLLVILVAEVAAGVWAWQNRNEFNAMVESSVQHTVKDEYNVVHSRTVAFDSIQHHFECCGAKGPLDWKSSRLNRKENEGLLGMTISSVNPMFHIPQSCCKKGTDKMTCEAAVKMGVGSYVNPVVNTEGCMSKLVKEIERNQPIFAGVILGIVAVQVLGLLFSLFLCCAVKRTDNYKA